MSEYKDYIIEYYKCKEGLFIRFFNGGEIRYSRSVATLNAEGGRVRFNKGKALPESTFVDYWFFYKGEKEIKTLEVKGKSEQVNFRWELNDKKTPPKKIKLPKVLTPKEVGEWYDDDDYAYYWDEDSEFYGFQQFYKRVHDTTNPDWEEIDFNTKKLGDIEFEDIKLPYSNYNVEYTKDNTVQKIDLKRIASFEMLDQMVTDPLFLHKRPCKLSVKQSYEIVRQYVKSNIDRKYARVSSDYDFSFTVKKIYQIKPYTRQWEEKKANGKSYARPRIRHKTIQEKEEVIYNISTDGRHGAIMECFYGDSLKDLTENVKLYLEELLFYINQPLKECEHCGGTGVIFESEKPKVKTEKEYEGI